MPDIKVITNKDASGLSLFCIINGDQCAGCFFMSAFKNLNSWFSVAFLKAIISCSFLNRGTSLRYEMTAAPQVRESKQS